MSLKSKVKNAKDKVVTFVDENRNRIVLAVGAGVATFGTFFLTYLKGYQDGCSMNIKRALRDGSTTGINNALNMIEDHSDLTHDEIDGIVDEYGKDYHIIKKEDKS